MKKIIFLGWQFFLKLQCFNFIFLSNPQIKNISRYIIFSIKIIVIYIFLKCVLYQGHILCIKMSEYGKLGEGIFQSWRYLYYGYNPFMKSRSEEILNFYIETMQKVDIKISTRITNYNFVGQKNFMRSRFWGHYSVVYESILQPTQEISFNLMLTTNDTKIIDSVKPNFLELSKKTIFLKNQPQLISNYAIFLDKNDIFELNFLCEKNKTSIENYLVNNNKNILDKFNNVIQNYKRITF